MNVATMTNVPVMDIAEQVRSVTEMANNCSSEGPAMVSSSSSSSCSWVQDKPAHPVLQWTRAVGGTIGFEGDHSSSSGSSSSIFSKQRSFTSKKLEY